MTRTSLFTVLLVGLFADASRGQADPIPPPREVRPDGSRLTAPPPDPDTQAARATRSGAPVVAVAADPAETVERIIKNSKEITDRLAKTDTGKDTLKTQDETLVLIDSLLNSPNPPPSGGSDNKKDMNDQKDKKDKKDPSGGMDKQDPKAGMDSLGGNQPQNDDRQANNGRRPRVGSEKGDLPKGSDPNPMAKEDTKTDPITGAMANSRMPIPMNPMPGGQAGPNAGNPTGTVAAKPTVPLDDEVVKDVWGHLPDKLRQQVSQYYKEEFMPRYSELLKQYYSSLANQNPKLPEMKR